MENNDKLFSVEETEDSKIIKLYPSSLERPLEDKLSKDNILLGLDEMNRVMQLADVRNMLCNSCFHSDCPLKEKSEFRALPNGYERADVMFIGKAPTEYEALASLSHCDSSSVFLNMILEKIHINRSSVYVTDFIKCHYQSQNIKLQEPEIKSCVENYLLKEISLVDPKIIIFEGLAVPKTLSKLGYIENLQVNPQYGKIYEVKINGLDRKIVGIFEIGIVLQKEGQEYRQCKDDLWKQLVEAFKSTKG